MYLNKVQLIGNLTRDPELKAIPSGIKVCTFSLATNRTWKDQNGAKQEATDFHNVVSFGKIAELIAQYTKKGSSLYIEGRIQTRSWEQDGQKKYRTEIITENFQFGPRPTGSEGPQTRTWHKEDDTKPKGGSDEVDTIEYPQEDINAEDIPF